MHNRIQDTFLGLCLGYYFNPTFILFGFEIQWVLIGLIISVSITVLKKLFGFLWKKLVDELKKEIFN